jgi:hypothetical protein
LSRGKNQVVHLLTEIGYNSPLWKTLNDMLRGPPSW